MDRALSLLSFSSPLKRLYKFLLKKVLGSFLLVDLDLHQLDVQLAKGELELRDLELNVNLLNELCVDLPIKFIRARIRLVRATIPWRNLLSQSCVLKLDGWELVVVPSEQVAPRASATFSALLEQSVLAVDIDHTDLEMQKSLASLGKHFRVHSIGVPATPLSGSGMSSQGMPHRQREAQEAEEEKQHEAITAASIRAREKRLKQAEQRRLRREQLGVDDDEEEPAPEAAVSVESDADQEDEDEAAASVRKHSARQAAALDTANEGLKVVASFLEQVVSAIELEVTDVSIRVQHQPRQGSAQTSLMVKLPWVKFEDHNKDRQKQEQSMEEQRKEMEARAQQTRERREAIKQKREAERQRRRAQRAARAAASAAAAASSRDGSVEDEFKSMDSDGDGDADAHLDDAALEEEEDEAAILREMEIKMARDQAGAGVSGSIHLNSGPRYEYHKSIRFHGFRVELHEEAMIDGSIAHFDPSIGASMAAPPPAGLPLERNLSEPDLDSMHSQVPTSDPQTIIAGTHDQECIITLKLKMQDTMPSEPKLESTMFIRSLRALITPRQLALLTDLAGAIGLSAKQVAINAQLAQQTALTQQQPPPPIVLNNAGGFSPSVHSANIAQAQMAALPGAGVRMPGGHTLHSAHPLSHPDYRVIERLLAQSSNANLGDSALLPEDQFFELPDSVNGDQAPASQGAEQVISLWNMETHILHCSLALMHSDEQTWPTDWWSQPAPDASMPDSHSHDGTQIVQASIPGIASSHLLLAVHHTFLSVSQTSVEASVKLKLGALQLSEFLVQQRAQQRRHGQLPRPFEHRAAQHVSDGDWIGFHARPLISFESTDSPPLTELQFPDPSADSYERVIRPVANPHLSIEMRSSVDSNHSLSFNEPMGKFFEPHPGGSVTSRITLSCQPATIHFDLGIGTRLAQLLTAVGDPSAYLHGAPSQPSSAHSEHDSFMFDLQRMQHASGLPPMGAEELLDRIASNAHRRHSFTEARIDGGSYAQTVLLAPTVHLNILFPAATPSQLQPHPYARTSQLTQDPYIDARGILRPERVELELHEVSVCNECEVASSNASMDGAHDARAAAPPPQDAEWLVRFQTAAVFMHFPNLEDAGANDSLDELEVISKRLLTTSYPSPQPVHVPAAYYAYAAVPPSYISILTRAPPQHGPQRFQPAHDGDADAAADGSSSSPSDADARTEQMFFDGLPNLRFWEPQMLDGQRQRVFKGSTQPDADLASVGGHSQTPQQPDAAIFESMAVANSGLVVTVHLPVAALHLAKADYDMVMFLFNIYSEVSSGEQAQLEESLDGTDGMDAHNAAMDDAHSFAHAMQAPDAMHHSMMSSTQEEEYDAVDPHGLARSQMYRHPASSFDGGLRSSALDDDDTGMGLHPGALSRSDSFSSDSSSELFESVLGTESVILKPKGGPSFPHGHRSRMPFPHGGASSAMSAHRGAPAQPSVLKPHASMLLPSLESLRISKPASSAEHMPLTMDSLGASPGTLSQEHKRDEGESQEEDAPLTAEVDAHVHEDDDDEPHFQPSLEMASRSVSPRSRFSPSATPPLQHPPHADHIESTLSDASEDSMPGESDDELNHEHMRGGGNSHGDVDDAEHKLTHRSPKRISFGTDSLLLPQQRASAGAMAEAAGELLESQHSDGGADSNASSSTDINPASIFARASRTSGQAQLFQPASLAMSSMLPPVSELVHPSTLAASSLMRSSMMQSFDDGRQFESFIEPPPGVFDPRASIGEASVDYSHLPSHRGQATLPQNPQLLQRSMLGAEQPLSVEPLPPVGAISAARLAPRNVPPPISAASAFTSPPDVDAAGGSAAPPFVPMPPAPAPRFFRHFMSLRLNIQRASIVLQDDPERSSDAQQAAASLSSGGGAASSSAQTFHADFGEVRLFQVLEYNGDPVTYIALRAGDLTLREYHAVLTDERQLFLAPSMPILFKTMGEEGGAEKQQAAQPNIDPWGQNRAGERKYPDPADAAAASTPPPPTVPLRRHDSESSSVAWKNPVLLLNFVIRLKPQLNLRDTQMVVNLRALTWQLFPESNWIAKIMAFFAPAVYTPPPVPPMFNVAAPAAPPPPPEVKSLLHVHVHAYDVAIDYNPVEIAPRAVISLDHLHLSTTVYPDSTLSVLKIEVRDVALFAVPHSSKAHYASSAMLSELGQPYLHRVGASSLFSQLDALGYARLATLDVLDVVITQNVPAPGASAAAVQQLAHIPAFGLDISNGKLSLFTCWDSFKVLIDVCTHFSASIIQVQQVAEVDVQFESDNARPAVKSLPPPIDGPLPSDDDGSFQPHAIRHRAAYLLDDDEVDDGEERKGEPQPASQPPPQRDILEDIDHNAFGADLGVAQVFQAGQLELHVNEDYNDQRAHQTSLAMALEAAAARELERARREEGGFVEERGAALARADALPNHVPAASASQGDLLSPSDEQGAKWLSARESDEIAEIERHEAYLLSLGDDRARQHEVELAQQREERRRRRVEQARSGGAARDAKDARVPPNVLEYHVPVPDADTITGRARLRPPADYPPSVSVTSLVNLEVCWRMFGGQDWDRKAVDHEKAAAAPVAGSSAARARAASSAQPAAAAYDAGPFSSSSYALQLRPEDSPLVHNDAMGSVDIDEFYQATAPFVKPSQHPFAPPHLAPLHGIRQRHGDMATIRLPNEPYRTSQRQSHVIESYTHQQERDASQSPVCDVIPRGHRQTDRVMELVLKGVHVRYDAFPTGLQLASRLVVALDDVAVNDLLTTSPFNYFLCYYQAPGSQGRELGSSMLRLEMTSVRPDPSRAREEYRVTLSVLPLRLNVDQSALEFLIEFFTHKEDPDAEGQQAVIFAPADGEAAAAPSAHAGAQFHQMYGEDEQPLNVAEAQVLASLTQLLLMPGAPRVARVTNTAHARVLCVDMQAQAHLSLQSLADALKCTVPHLNVWLAGAGYDQTIGAAAVKLLNRLQRPAQSPDLGDDVSDEEDEELSAGMGMAPPVGSRTCGMCTKDGTPCKNQVPCRWHGPDTQDPFQGFRPPPMPRDWIPSSFARAHPNLVPILTEAYDKYYDVLHASMPSTLSTGIEMWQLPSSLLAVSPAESANEFRMRALAAARSAARTQLKVLGATAVREVDSQTYIQSFQVMHKILLCIDWKPNTFDLQGLRHGDYAQLANLLPLENMCVELKPAKLLGITGFDRVGAELGMLWAYDLAHHQAHRYLAGVQPIRSFVNVGSGVADLVLVPLAHVRQHGSLKRGVQRGLSSFLRNVSLESMAAAARLAQGAQSILESADDLLTYRPAPLPSHANAQFAQQRARKAGRRPGAGGDSPAAAPEPRRPVSHVSKRANPPPSAAEGLRQAYDSLSRGLQSAAAQMIVVPRDEYQRYGSRGAVRSALQAVPGALLSPVIGGMEAVAKVLNGAASSLQPSRVQEHRDKFKHTQKHR